MHCELNYWRKQPPKQASHKHWALIVLAVVILIPSGFALYHLLS